MNTETKEALSLLIKEAPKSSDRVLTWLYHELDTVKNNGIRADIWLSIREWQQVEKDVINAAKLVSEYFKL